MPPPRGLEPLSPPLGYAGQPPARSAVLSEPSGRTGYLRRRRLQCGPRGCAQQLPSANERPRPGGDPRPRPPPPRREGRRAPAEKPPPRSSEKGFHQYPTHPPAPKSGELFHRLRLLHLHNHLQTAIQVSCSQSFQRFVIECAINPENEVRKKKGGGEWKYPSRPAPSGRQESSQNSGFGGVESRLLFKRDF